MKLTKREIEYLKQCGEDEEGIEQVKEVVCNRNLKITISYNGGKEKPIAYNKAKKLLGWETFIGAIHRASFHWDCGRRVDDNTYISFDARKYFGY